MEFNYIQDMQEYLTEIKQDIETSLVPSRERSLVITKIDEAYLWLSLCTKKENTP